MRRVTRIIAAAAFFLVTPPSRVDAAPREALVPWKVAQPGRVETAPLTLYWIPAASEDVRRSELLISDALTLYSSRCVRMRVVRIDDRARVVRFAAAEALPQAVLVDDRGVVLGKVNARDGALERAEVERLVREELERRETAADAMLDDARAKADADDDAGAAALYRIVREARCMCPRQGRDAARALRKLRNAQR